MCISRNTALKYIEDNPATLEINPALIEDEIKMHGFISNLRKSLNDKGKSSFEKSL